MRIFNSKYIVLLAAWLAAFQMCRATTFVWTNTLGGNWSVAANWSPHVVPGQLNAFNSEDDVLITNAGTYTVTLDVGASPDWWDIRALTLGGGSGSQTLALTNKILYVAPLTVTNGGVLAANNSDFHAVIAIANGGKLNSTNGNYFVNPLTIAGGGTFTTHGNTIFESGGLLENAGALNISNGNLTLDMAATNSGAMSVSAGAGLSIDNTLTLAGPLTNSGTMNISGGGAISISNNLSTTRGGIVNLSGGEINLDNAKGITGGGNHEFLINQGAINSTGGGYIQSVPGFTNSGTIDVSATTLNLDSGLHLESSGSLNVQLNSAGSYGKIAISGNTTLSGALNVTLGNSFNPQNGNSFQPVTYTSFSGNFTSTNLPTLVPWQLTYDPSAVTLSVTTRTITWTNTLGGNWSDPNNWSPNIVPGGTTYGNDDDAQITAAGTYTVILDEGSVSTAYYLHSLALGAGSGVQTLIVTNTWPDVASMSVNAGGQVNSSGSYWFNNWVTPLAIASGGIFNSTNDLFNQHVTVNGGGIFTAANTTNGNGWFAINGALNVSAGVFVLNGATTNSGTLTVSNGASLSVNDNLVLSGAGGIVNLPGGAIDIANGHGISGDDGAEYLANQGAINSTGGYILSVPGFANSGEINSVTGTLNLDSGLLLQSSGSLNSQLNSASDYGKIVISGNAALNGAFDVTLNYSPDAGDSFTPLTYDSYSGNFSSYNLPASGAGQSWQTSLGATALTLQIAETVIWTNTDGGNWSDAANWNPNKVPGQFDDVGITAPGTYTVVMDPSTVNIRSLTLGTGSGVQTLAVTNKTFYVNPLTITGGGVLAESRSTFHAAITVENGGQLNSTSGTYFVNPLTIAIGGEMTAYGYYVYGAIMFHGNVVVNDGGVLTIPASGGYTEIANDGSMTVADGGLIEIPSGRLFLYGPMTNSGTVNLTGGGSSTDIRIDNNGTANDQGFLLNLPGGTINLNGNSGVIAADYHNDQFINQGTIVNTSSSHSISVSDFDNSAGVVSNLFGTLSLSTFTNMLAGSFYTTNGTTIKFSGGTATTPLKPGVPLELTGGGNFQFIKSGNYGWLDLTNDIIPNLQMISGVLELEPTFQGGAITNLALDGILLTNAPDVTWPVTGNFAVTNSTVYGNFIVENGGELLAYFGNPYPTFYGDIQVENNSMLMAQGAYFYGDVTVDGGGEFDNLNSGTTLQPGGSLTIASGGTLNSGYLFYDDGPMTNFGTINITNFGSSNQGYSIVLKNDGSSYFGGLINEPDGLINIAAGANATPGIVRNGSYNQEYFINQGMFVSAASAGVDVADFENSGTVTNLNGTLTLGVFHDSLAGNFYTASGATTKFYGGTAANPLTPGALAMDGSGQFQFIGYNGYGWLDLPSDIVPNIDLRSGVLELEPTFQGGFITNLTLDGIIFTNANALPIGTTNNLTRGIFNTTNSLLAGTFIVTNNGTWNAYADNIYGPVIIQNGGILNDENTIQIHPPGSLTVAQNGQVNLAGGYLYLYAPATNSGVVNLPNNNNIYIYNNGTANLGGLLNQSSGAVNFFSYGGINGSEGQDYFVNNGSIVKSSYSGSTSINVSDFTNSGAITSQEGTLQLNKVTLQSSGSLDVRLNSKTDYGKFSISGATTLTGAFGASLNGTYVPGVGDSFTPLTYGSFTGNFTATNLPPLVAWQTTYNPTALTLLVTQTGLIPEFTTFVSAGGDLIFNGTNGTPGNTYWVLTSTNVTQPLADWMPIATNIFDGVGRFSFTNSPDAGKLNQFFILKLP